MTGQNRNAILLDHKEAGAAVFVNLDLLSFEISDNITDAYNALEGLYFLIDQLCDRADYEPIPGIPLTSCEKYARGAAHIMFDYVTKLRAELDGFIKTFTDQAAYLSEHEKEAGLYNIFTADIKETEGAEK